MRTGFADIDCGFASVAVGIDNPNKIVRNVTIVAQPEQRLYKLSACLLQNFSRRQIIAMRSLYPTREGKVVARPLAAVIEDQQRVFAQLLEAQRELERLSRSGHQPGIIDGQQSDTDSALAAAHDAQHQLEMLMAEALNASLALPD